MTTRNLTHKPQERIQWIDALRGFTLLQMLAFHALWDLVFLFGVELDWYRSTPGYLWQQGICWTFLLLSGYCVGLGKHLLRRGLLVSAGGAGIMLATYFVMPERRVVFGVLTCLGLCMLLMVPLRRYLEKIPAWLGLGLSMLLFFLTRNIPRENALGFEGLTLVQLPESLRQGGYGMMLLGFRNPEIRSTDYFPLLPWVFLFVAGFFLYRLTAKYLDRIRTNWRWLVPLCVVGRHTLWVYLLHQPILYGVLYVVMGASRG